MSKQALNHRKLVKQLFHQGTLQSMLSLPLHPRQSSIPLNSNLSDSDLRRQSAQAVESAWHEFDSSYDHTEEQSVQPNPSSSDDEEDSRYNANKANKRRRVDPLSEGPVYMEESDDVDESDADLITAHPGGTLEEKSVTNQIVDAEKAKARRAYWASKGMPGGDLENSDYYDY